jgi:hypothetical protein
MNASQTLNALKESFFVFVFPSVFLERAGFLDVTSAAAAAALSR